MPDPTLRDLPCPYCGHNTIEADLKGRVRCYSHECRRAARIGWGVDAIETDRLILWDGMRVTPDPDHDPIGTTYPDPELMAKIAKAAGYGRVEAPSRKDWTPGPGDWAPLSGVWWRRVGG